MPPALYPKLRDVFLNRVIGIEAVQDERAAAIEESRQPGAPASTDNIERFFDHGILPGRGHLWRISTAELGKAPAKPTALDRAIAAAWNAWRQFVRELRNGALVATGEGFEWPHPAAVDRQEIDRGTWLDDTLWFDVRANAICVEPSGKIRRWFNIRVRGADEAAEFEDDQPAKEDATTTGKRKQRALNKSKQPAGEPAAATADQLDAPRQELSDEQQQRVDLFYAVVGDQTKLKTPRLLAIVGTAEKPSKAWVEACRKRGLDPVHSPPPKRHAINRMLGRRRK